MTQIMAIVIFALQLYLMFSVECTLGQKSGHLKEAGKCSNCTMMTAADGIGIDIHCEWLGFFHIPTCKIPNARSLHLEDNNIKVIHKNAFIGMPSLENIYLSRNQISFIQGEAFKGLRALKYLNVERNKLSDTSFVENSFVNLETLVELITCDNNFKSVNQSTFHIALSRLHGLEKLELQGYFGLRFNDQISNLKLLKYLKISDRMVYKNNTFDGFYNNIIQYLDLNLVYMESGALAYFQNLKGISVKGEDNIINILEALWPFKNKTFEYLRFHDNANYNSFNTFNTLTSWNFRYLATICTKELDLRDNDIAAIEHTAVTSLLYRKCIKKLNLSRNPYQPSLMFIVPEFENLEYLDVCCRKSKEYRRKRSLRFTINQSRNPFIKSKRLFSLLPAFHGYTLPSPNKQRKLMTHNSLEERHLPKAPCTNKLKPQRSQRSSERPWRQPSINRKITHNSRRMIRMTKKTTLRDEQLQRIIQLVTIQKKSEFVGVKKSSNRTKSDGNEQRKDNRDFVLNRNEPIVYRNKRFFNNVDAYGYVFSGKKLKFVNASHIGGSYLRSNITVIGGENIEYLDLAYNVRLRCDFFVKGISNLKMLNVSSCNCAILKPNVFLHHYPNLQYFVAVGAKLGQGLQKDPDGIFFKGLHKLRHVNFAKNGLTELNPNLFLDQGNSLRTLILSENDLLRIPLNLELLLSLELLDLSYNGLGSFVERELSYFEDLFSKEVHIELRGNKFGCGCNDEKFLEWILKQEEHIADFDFINCITETAQWKSLRQMNNTLVFFEKHCSAEFWLIFSISGVITLSIILILSVIVFRNRLSVEFFIQRLRWLFSKNMNIDFMHDVFICASIDDAVWVRDSLLHFLENSLELNTCFHHRDSIPGYPIADSLYEGIQNSRKVIFVITENYLQSEWLQYELEQARLSMFNKYFENNILMIFREGIHMSALPSIIKTLDSRLIFLKYPVSESEDDLRIFWKKVKKSFKNHKRNVRQTDAVQANRNEVV